MSTVVVFVIIASFSAVFLNRICSAADAATTVAPTAQKYNISVGIIWDSADVDAVLQRQFNTILLPSAASSCPNSSRISSINFRLKTYPLGGILSLDQIGLAKQDIRDSNYLFIGVKRSSLTSMLGNLSRNTSVPDYPRGLTHDIGPLPPRILESALISVTRQLINESLYPKHPQNRRAAVIADRSYDVTEMNNLFTFFDLGVLYFLYDRRTLENALLTIRERGIVNIFALISSKEADYLKVVAFSLNMFVYQYRWIFHGARLTNVDFDPRMVTYTTNITSIEFGRVRDTLKLDLLTHDDVFINDLVSIWKIYLQRYLCNDTAPIPANINGFTGRFALLPGGHVQRVYWELQIYRGLESRRRQIGKWRSVGGLEIISMPDKPRLPNATLEELRYNPFRVVTFITPPFVGFKTSVPKNAPLSEQLTGMYIGICKTLLARLGITNYEFVLQPDGTSGTLVNGVWSGLMGTVSQGKAHLGCAPITMQASRRLAVRFSQVIHTAPLSILLKKKVTDMSQEIFRFLQPMEMTIWLGVLGLLLCFSVVLSALHRAEPEPRATLSIYDSIFFSLAEALQGNTSLLPDSISCRIAISGFWFFTIFLLLAYAANSASFRLLAAEDKQPDSLEDLVRSDKYEFCVVKNGAIMSLMRDSVNVHAQQAYALMTQRFRNGLVDGIPTAVGLILNSSAPFALIADSLQNANLQDTNCGLASSGSFYMLKTALIMPRDSEYAGYFDTEIIKMASQASLTSQFLQLTNSQRPDCSDSSFLGRLLASLPPEPWPVNTESLGLSSSLGITVVNLVGCCLALAISGVEFTCGRLLRKRSDRRRTEQTAHAFAASLRPMR